MTIASSDDLFLTVNRSNVSINELKTSIVIIVIIPGTDPDSLSFQIMFDLFETGGGDISETDTIGGAEHDGLIVGEGFRTQQETGNGCESEDCTDKSSLDNHGCVLTA